MSVVNNQQAHAFATIPGVAPAINVIRADGCVLTHPFAGTIRLVVPVGFGGPPENLKVTVNVTPPGSTGLVSVLQWVDQQTIEILTFDNAAAPVLTDPDSIWVTVEIVPRVS